MTCARRGVSLEQRTHRPVMFQSCFVSLGTSFATVDDAAHRTDARNCAQRHRPVAFATEGLRLVLCFAFNCRIRAESKLPEESGVLRGVGKRQPAVNLSDCFHIPAAVLANFRKPAGSEIGIDFRSVETLLRRWDSQSSGE